MDPCPLDSRAQLVHQLAEQVRRIERGALPGGTAGVSSGCAALDRLLPQGRFVPGTLVEWLAASPASGAGTLAFLVARQAASSEKERPGGSVVVVDRQGEFYPPAARGLGLALAGLIVVRPRNDRDERWAVDQALRCRGVAALVAWPERLDGRTFRRWQLAAEAGGCLGMLLRPERARREPSWAEARLWVEPCSGVGSAVRTKGSANERDSVVRTADPTGRRVRIEVLHARGGATGRSVELEIDDATPAVRVAPQLAAATLPRRSAGA